MKGRIFIAWSGNNKLALEVKRLLETKDYIGVVGGEGGASNGLFVGHTVLDEINHCNQAIFVVQKKADGTISNNLMFEFGYSLARFSSNKIHVFYIDIKANDEHIPSDLKGIWADFFMTSECDNIAAEITNKFLSAQKHIIPEDKMTVVNDYYNVKNMIQSYSNSPRCSEYELAQYILFFSQAAYLFKNEKESLLSLKNLSASLRNPGPELELSIRLSIYSIEFFLKIQKKGETLYIKKEDYRNLSRRLRSMEETAATWNEDDFTKWFFVILYDIANYSRILYSFHPDVTEDRRNLLLTESLEYADKCNSLCDDLLKDSTNQHFAELLKAYMYRNIATAQKVLQADQESIRKNLFLSRDMRGELWDYYNEIKRINSKLLESFEMEYYLALSEVLEFIEDPMDLDDFRDDCEDYLSRVNTLNSEKSHFISKIEYNLSTSGK